MGSNAECLHPSVVFRPIRDSFAPPSVLDTIGELLDNCEELVKPMSAVDNVAIMLFDKIDPRT